MELKATRFVPTVPLPPTRIKLELDMSIEEATILRDLVGGIYGGFGSPLGLGNTVQAHRDTLRQKVTSPLYDRLKSVLP